MTANFKSVWDKFRYWIYLLNESDCRWYMHVSGRPARPKRLSSMAVLFTAEVTEVEPAKRHAHPCVGAVMDGLIVNINPSIPWKSRVHRSCGAAFLATRTTQISDITKWRKKITCKASTSHMSPRLDDTTTCALPLVVIIQFYCADQRLLITPLWVCEWMVCVCSVGDCDQRIVASHPVAPGK